MTSAAHQVEPRFAVVEFTTPHLSFAEDLDVYARAGATGIGIVEVKLTDDAEDLASFERSGLAASSAAPAIATILPSPALPGPDDPSERLDVLLASLARTAPFAPECFTLSTGPLGERSLEEARSIVAHALGRLAAEADALGTRLALELLHPTLASLFSFATDMAEGIRLLDESGSATAGLAVDAWHVGDGPDILDELEAHAARIATVHLNDRREPTRSWADRVLPGDGILDLAGMLAALRRGGFSGWYELEVVSDDGTIEHDFEDSLWKRDPQSLISDGRAKVITLLEGSATRS
jgi:sugar phosphate isomerase/epimerase